MKNNKPFRICHCGQVYETEMDVYKNSIPRGLQKFPDEHFELRDCPNCGTTFTIPFPREISGQLEKKLMKRIASISADPVFCAESQSADYRQSSFSVSLHDKNEATV